MEKRKVKMRLNALVIALLAVVVCISGFAQAAEQPSPRLTLISNVNIFDGKSEKLHKNMHVLVKDNLIETVSDEPLAVIQTDNVTMIDGDPTKDIRLLMDADKNIDLIMRDGKIYKNTLKQRKNEMKRILKTAVNLVLALALAMPATAADYDLVILNGRVMDPETKYDAVSNVGIKDGRIAVITKNNITGKETIDATGLVVAPGFIDGHQHCIEPYAYRLMLRDGRTTIMDLEVGAHGPKLNEWYKRREGKSPINFGVSVSHEFARAAVLDGFNDWKYLYTPDALRSRVKQGWSKTRPSLEQGNQILAAIDEGLRQGGLGIGSTLGYMREGVSAREVFELQKLSGLYGRSIDMHFRYTPGDDVGEVNGIQEMLANAAALGTPAIAAHFNNAGYNLVHELLVRMRERGYNVWGEIYPYAAGSTALNAVFLEPEVWVKALGHKYEDTVQDVATGEFYTQKTREEMLKKEPTRPVIVYKIPESAVVDWIKMPGVAIGSDGMPLVPDDNLTWDTPYEDFPNTHPRFAGSFAKVLHLARENNIPLMQAVSMTSYNYAKPLGDMGLKAMQVRGRMQKGMVADITIFDPQTVTDNSTYAKGTLPSTGILHVIVNGITVMKDQEPQKGVNPGQPIRFEPVKSRFEPLSIENWTKTYYAAPVDFGGGVPGSQPDIHQHRYLKTCDGRYCRLPERNFSMRYVVLCFCIAVIGCAAGAMPDQNTRSTDPQSVSNKTWQWVSTITPVEKITVTDPERYTIMLTEDGKLQARFDCNRGGGEYRISEGKLSLGPLRSTRMACPEDSLDGPFMRDLQRVSSFFLQGGLLYLELPYDSGTMKFRPAP